MFGEELALLLNKLPARFDQKKLSLHVKKLAS